MKTKINTTKEQSEKLIELGLDIKTADMFLALDGTVPVVAPYIEDDLETAYDGAIPSWSLAILLKIFPAINIITFKCKFRCEYWKDEWTCGPEYVTYYYDDVIDAVFEMMCWLLKNHYIEEYESYRRRTQKN
jgi:hypothetical protein